ncbi:MAG: tetratricopeptide repeat protein [Gallionellaceae bacterium]
MLIGILAAPFAAGSNLFDRNDVRDTVNLEYRAAAYELYQKRYFSSIQQYLHALSLPGATAGRSDNMAFFSDYLYEERDLAYIRQILVAGRLADTPLSKDETDVVLADLYLAAGMPKPAERLLVGVGDRRTASPKHSWLALARFYYQRGYFSEAQQALSHLLDIPSGELQIQRDSLAALAQFATGHDDDAIAILRASSAQGEQLALDQYDLGLALLQNGDTQGALATFGEINNATRSPGNSLYFSKLQSDIAKQGKSPQGDAASGKRLQTSFTSFLKDIATISLSQVFQKQRQTDLSAAALQDIGADVPGASYALLDKGWVDFRQNDVRGALASWQPLSKRDISDAAVQEGLLVTAYSYYHLQDYARAMDYFQRAAHGYEQELERIQAARGPLSDGSYLKMLLGANVDHRDFDSGWRAQTLPASAINSYLLPALASHRFVAAFSNYRDLLATQEILTTAGADIDASLDLIAKQRSSGAAGSSIKKAQISLPDRKSLLDKIRKVRSALAKAAVHRDIMAFATVKQMQVLTDLRDADALLRKLQEDVADNNALRDRYQLLRGLLLWDLTEQYPTRLREVKLQLQDLENAVNKYAGSPAEVASDPAIADNTLSRREGAYNELRTKQGTLLTATPTLIAAHERYLEALLDQSLQDGMARLNLYLTEARLGVAVTADQLAGAAPAKDYTATIAAYQTFLDHGGESPYRRDVMLRQAYLKMQQADELPSGQTAAGTNSRGDAAYEEAIALLEQALKSYPSHRDDDLVLYNLAKAYDHRGDTIAMLDALDRIAANFPDSAYIDETQFRRGELLFSLALADQAAAAYGAIVKKGPASPFFDKALYKLGWSRFKLGQYDVAVDAFIPLLETKLALPAGAKTASAPQPQITRGEEEFVNDILRGACLSVAQLHGVDTLRAYFARHGARPFEYRLYQTLAQLYLEQQRIADAVNVYRTFVTLHPNDPLAPTFDSLALAAYDKGRFIDLLQNAKADFIERYQPASDYWKTNPGPERDATLATVHDYLADMTSYAHAKAQQTKSAADYQQAEHWYQLSFQSFPHDPLAANTHFLYAELLYEDRRFAAAAQEYAKVAYDYKDAAHGAEAGYANILAHEQIAAGLGGADRAAAEQQTLLALQRFTDTFPEDSRSAATLIKIAQKWFAQSDQAKAEHAAQRLLDIKPPADPVLRGDAWIILAHGQFDRGLYSEAELSYQQALALIPAADATRLDIAENLAAAVYKQGDAARKVGDMHGAARYFLRVKELTPEASIVATAQYDGAAALLASEDWPQAISVLEAFRADYPGNPLQKDVPPKLAVAYQKVGNWRKAAAELETITAQGDGEELQRDAVWQAAGLYTRSGQIPEAQRMYREYVQRFPKAFTDVIEAQQHLADLYAQQGDAKQQQYWLQQIVDTDKRGGSVRTERSRLLAGRAALTLADARYRDYIEIKLTHPLKKSLKHKKEIMEEALAAYRSASDYGIADITTASTYHAAQIYSNLGNALLDSERPNGLSVLELEQYNVLLEEQAYPFEEQAIALHEANARRTTEHIYDDWVKQSFTALSKLLPGRYAKTEKGEAYVDALY